MKKFATLLLLVYAINANAYYMSSYFCDTRAGMSGSYVLALSSQPGFCQTYGYEAGKPECMHLPKNSYQAKHLTLHGLWPNQYACGRSYGYCGVEPKSNYCAYYPLNLSSPVVENLKKVMPGYYYGSCLERHEWNKHGSCQILSADEYFSLAIRLTTEVDDSAFGLYLTQHQGEKVKLTTLREKVAHSFGKKNVNKVYFGCNYGILVDIYIQLPALIPRDKSIQSLIDEAPDLQGNNACPRNVTLSNFSK